jgi:hypothetical protein
MFGLDDRIAHLSNGSSVVVVILVAALLGLRHATDPDHVAAVTTLVATSRERAARRAAELGAFWGLGHALALIVFALPITLFGRYLPEPVQRGAETAVGAMIVLLALRLLIRWRGGYFDTRARVNARAARAHQVRTPVGAFGIGLVHGMGGSAGVAVLLLAAIPSRPLALACLLVLAFFTAVSMTMVTSGFGRALVSTAAQRRVATIAPLLGFSSLAFGVWYAAAVWSLAPYPF